MAIKINQNIFSLLVQRNLANNTRQLEHSYERLSSGLRINRSADDPSGLATSERLRYEIQGLRQNQRNVGAALSLSGTAESQLDSINTQLQRARELAVQAATDTLGPEQRQLIQTEINQIKEEINRVAADSRYNDLTLLNGTTRNLKLQVGNTGSEFLSLSLGDYRIASLGARAELTAPAAVDATVLSEGELTLAGVAIPASKADGFSTVDAAASALAKARAINEVESRTGVHATALPAAISGTTTMGGTTIDGVTRRLQINGVAIGPLTVASGDSGGGLAAAINRVTGQTGVSASVDASGRLQLSAADGRNLEVVTTGGLGQTLGLTAAGGDVTQVGRGSIRLTSTRPFAVDGQAGRIGIAGTPLLVQPDAGTAIGFLDVLSAPDATEALRTIDAALAQVNDERSKLGALYGRLEAISDSLARQSEDLTASDSRIRESDFALETARLTQAQIMQEAAVAMLAQANVAPRRALELLQG